MDTLNTNYTSLKSMLEHKSVDEEKEVALVTAAIYNHPKLVRLLLQDQYVDPCFGNQLALIESCRLGHIMVVHELLKDPRVDPRARNYEAFYQASQHGHRDILKMLLLHEQDGPIRAKLTLLLLMCRGFKHTHNQQW